MAEDSNISPVTLSAAPPMGGKLGTQLSIMMFLQYAIWGAWLPLFFAFLTEHRGFSGEDAGWLFAIGATGALLAPFVAGQIADRWFNTEKFLALSHILGGVLVWQLARITEYRDFIIFGLLYSLIYTPTLALTNSLAFHHLPDRDRDFGRVRVWGTIGWIAVGIGMGQWLLHRHSPTYEEAATQAIQEQLFDDKSRQALVDETVVTREAGKPLRGKIAEQDEQKVVLAIEIKGDDDKVATEKKTIEKSAVKKIQPAYETLAATDEGGNVVAAKAAAIRAAIDALNVSDDDAAKKKVTQDLVSGKALGDAAVTGPIRQGRVKGMADAFRLSAILGIILGVFCILLPKTPPQKGTNPFAAFEAVSELKKPRLLWMFLIAFPISCVHQFYFVRTEGFLGSLGVKTPAIDAIFGVGGGPMTIGQIAEIFVLALMPLVAKRYSRKSILVIGLLAYILRFAVFAYVPYAWAVYPALALHGVCFGCFFFVCFMIVDEETSSDVRASAQSLFNLVIIGFGVIVGNIAAGQVDRIAKTEEGTDFSILFSVPMWVTVACALLLLLVYPRGRSKRVVREAAV